MSIATSPYYNEILNLVNQFGWKAVDESVNNNQIVFAHRVRSNYRLNFSSDCVMIDEFEIPRAIYLNFKFKDDKTPVESLQTALLVFEKQYI